MTRADGLRAPRLVPPVLLACTILSGCVPDPGRAERLDAEYLRIVAAEDSRPEGGRELQTLVDGTEHHLAFIRHASVRALGRLERIELARYIEPRLDDPAALVRRSAANALAQAYHRAEDAAPAAQALRERVDAERDPAIRGAIARSLGRLALDPRSRREVADILVDISRNGEEDAPPATLVGVALGLESMVRRHPEAGVSARVAERLFELARYPTTLADDPVPARIRGLALHTLGIARRLTVPMILVALQDDEPQPPAAAARYIDVAPPAQRPEVLRRVIGHPLLPTVVEGYLRLQTASMTRQNCQYLTVGARSALTDEIRAPDAIGVLAVDALDRPCPDLEAQRDLLTDVAQAVDAEGTPWQAASRALVSLATVAPDRAATILPDHIEHDDPFIRGYTARAATVLGDRDVLRSLMSDASPNVRTVAASGLFALDGHAVDTLLAEQLRSDDPQLLLTAAELLEGTPAPDAVAEVALDAFVRISAAERETWRDPRRALLALLGDVGGPEMASALEPYLEDYDPVVAGDVADLLTEWTGRPYEAAPRALPAAPLPTVDELRAMDGAHVLLHMEDGGTIDIELHPHLATTNAYRFQRLVREGYFDGLTFHRWAPNFVIQGGSPGANEYQGAPAFSRDEVGLRPHWRGTVGISTRGHDTGDAQIFINLLDNVRLDHTYTIVGTVVDGMNVVDTVLEGDVIERAEVVTSR